MPKELRKRGRRAPKRQKLDHDANDGDDATNGETRAAPPQGLSLSTQTFVASGEAAADSTVTTCQLPFESSITAGATFFGLLDEQEQEYFRKADDMLETNQFKTDEEREAFTQNVLKEAENKELKMACSQGCSRLLEKLLALGGAERVKVVFQRFHGHFLHLMSHRFASHCCEALFTAAASAAAAEYLAPDTGADGVEGYVSAENLFLYTVTELEPSMDSLLMDAFGSHALRTLFLVLAGAPLDSPSYKALVHSKKKENISVDDGKAQEGGVKGQARPVPESFREALSKIINKITADIDRDSIRNLATDSLGSPTLQLLIELDLGRSRKHKTRIEQSLVGKLLLQLPGEEERDADATRSFVKMLLQDKVGSHLLERVMFCVPKKTFGQLYGLYFEGQLGKLATSETACFVVVKVLEKLESKEFKGAEEELMRSLPSLLENHRVAVIRTVIESCNRHGIDADGFCDALFEVWGGSEDGQGLLLKMLEVSAGELEKLETPDAGQQEKEIRNPSQLHASLLVQALLTVPGSCSSRVKECILSCDADSIRRLCKHRTASHAVQKSMTPQPVDIAHLRKLTALLAGSIGDLAVHPVGSHIVDTLWETTMSGLKLQRQRIADELLGSERKLRDSFYGRAVWRNWKMDLYKTRRYDWGNLNGEVKKSALQIASERHAKKAEEEQSSRREKAAGVDAAGSRKRKA